MHATKPGVTHHTNKFEYYNDVLPPDPELHKTESLMTTYGSKYTLATGDSLNYFINEVSPKKTNLYVDVKAERNGRTLNQYIDLLKKQITANGRFEILKEELRDFNHTLYNGNKKQCTYATLKIRNKETGAITDYVKYANIEDAIENTDELFELYRQIKKQFEGVEFEHKAFACQKGMSRSASLLLAEMLADGAKNGKSFQESSREFMDFWEERMKKTGRYDEEAFFAMPSKKYYNYQENQIVAKPIGMNGKLRVYSFIKNSPVEDRYLYGPNLIQVTLSWIFANNESKQYDSKQYDESKMSAFFELNHNGVRYNPGLFSDTVYKSKKFYEDAYNTGLQYKQSGKYNQLTAGLSWLDNSRKEANSRLPYETLAETKNYQNNHKEVEQDEQQVTRF